MKDGAFLTVIGACECGSAKILMPDSIDSGLAVQCTGGHTIVFDLWRPDTRAKFYEQVEVQYRELVDARRDLAVATDELQRITDALRETEELVEKLHLSICWARGTLGE